MPYKLIFLVEEIIFKSSKLEIVFLRHLPLLTLFIKLLKLYNNYEIV